MTRLIAFLLTAILATNLTVATAAGDRTPHVHALLLAPNDGTTFTKPVTFVATAQADRGYKVDSVTVLLLRCDTPSCGQYVVTLRPYPGVHGLYATTVNLCRVKNMKPGLKVLQFFAQGSPRDQHSFVFKTNVAAITLACSTHRNH